MKKIKKIELEHIDDVIELLRDISPYTPSKSVFQDNYIKFSAQKNCNGYVIIENYQVIAYGSIFYEIKIRGGKVGHIEDIVVKKSHRGKDIGKLLINHLIERAIENGCYKVSLECKEINEVFYKKCGFEVNGISMSKILL